MKNATSILFVFLCFIMIYLGYKVFWNEMGFSEKEEYGDLQSIYSLMEENNKRFDIIKWHGNTYFLVRSPELVVVLLTSQARPLYKQMPPDEEYTINSQEYDEIVNSSGGIEPEIASVISKHIIYPPKL